MERTTMSVEDPLAALERILIDEFLALRGFSRRSIARFPPPERALLLGAACEYASLRLAEIESRAHYVDEMHKST